MDPKPESIKYLSYRFVVVRKAVPRPCVAVHACSPRVDACRRLPASSQVCRAHISAIEHGRTDACCSRSLASLHAPPHHPQQSRRRITRPKPAWGFFFNPAEELRRHACHDQPTPDVAALGWHGRLAAQRDVVVALSCGRRRRSRRSVTAVLRRMGSDAVAAAWRLLPWSCMCTPPPPNVCLRTAFIVIM